MWDKTLAGSRATWHDNQTVDLVDGSWRDCVGGMAGRAWRRWKRGGGGGGAAAAAEHQQQRGGGGGGSSSGRRSSSSSSRSSRSRGFPCSEHTFLEAFICFICVTMARHEAETETCSDHRTWQRIERRMVALPLPVSFENKTELGFTSGRTTLRKNW